MKTFKELRKVKGLTFGKLAELSGVSAKTVSLYEQSPPARPSRKVLGKLSEVFEMTPEDLMASIYPKKRCQDTRSDEAAQGDIMLEESHVNRLLRLVDKELEDLRYLMVDTAGLTDEYPVLLRCMDMVSADIELLTEIKSRFLV